MKSNDDVPEDEMMLAKMLQNAKARNLKWHKGSYFKVAGNNRFCLYNEDAASLEACCAAGSLMLEVDTLTLWHGPDFTLLDGLVQGNDETGYEYWHNNDNNNGKGELIGHAFRQAMED